MKRIYLDNAATTKPDPMVLKSMNEVQERFWGNASSIYNEGQKAKQMLEDCRRSFASFIGCESEEIIFTSGGTEADNLAIKGVIDAIYSQIISSTNAPACRQGRDFNAVKNNAEGAAFQPRKDQRSYFNILPHIITSAFEHHAVLHTIQDLEKRGLIEATYVNPNSEGLIEVKDIEAAIRDNTVLVSIMYVNNEVGTVQPISEIAKMIKECNIHRFSTQKGHRNDTSQPINQLTSQPIIFHTDAVQAVEYFDIKPDNLVVDMISIAAHKFHGPKGVGVLYIRKNTPFVHQQIGGGQERKRRAGTENVAGIKGMTVAMQQIEKSRNQEIKKIRILRDKLIDGILKNIPDTVLNGSREKRSPANANITFKNAEGESIIMMLDMAGIAVSSGSACTSGSLEPSHVLLSMGVPAEEAHGSVRFTLSKDTTGEEINKVLEVLPPIIKKLRKMSPFNK